MWLLHSGLKLFVKGIAVTLFILGMSCGILQAWTSAGICFAVAIVTLYVWSK